MKRLCLLLVVTLLVLGWNVRSSRAIAPFKKAFAETYVETSDNEEFQAAAKKAGCYVCHVKGEKKDVRNPYGEVLSELIEGNAGHRVKEAGEKGDEAKAAETEKVLKELAEAFKKVEEKDSPSGGTFGERIKSGKLPVEMPAKE